MKRASSKAQVVAGGQQDNIVDEKQLASIIGMSVAFLQKDRVTRRLVPFIRLGGKLRGRILYDVASVRQALLSMQEGGPQQRNERASAAAPQSKAA